MATSAYEPSPGSRFPPLTAVDSVMLSIAVVTILWAVMRACHQSITMDEAMTWRSYVAPADPNHWTAHSNNHVLNSALMRLAIAAFGLSELSVRLPALVGASVYIGSCFFLCRLLFEEAPARVLVFVCLVVNPYLGDFFAAARGYSLAFGLLVCAITLVADLQFRQPADPPGKAARICGVVSVLLGLSFTANFSYALIDATTWAALMLWIVASQWSSTKRRERRQLLISGILPGVLVVFVLASSTLLDWSRDHLFDGARSLSEMFGLLATGALAEPNPEFANRLVRSLAELVRPYLIPALAGATIWRLAVVFGYPRPEQPRARKRLEFSIVVGSALLLALLVHWAAFHLAGLLLPRNRTSIYIIPLATLAVGSLYAIPAPKGLGGRNGRAALVGVLGVLAFYYVLCLRANYFWEWRICAETKNLYYVLAYYNHAFQVTDVPARPPLGDCLEFYRRASGRETLAEFKDPAILDAFPHGKKAYALYEPQDHDFITMQGLKVVYRGRLSNAVIAVQPGLAGFDSRPKADKMGETTYDDTYASFVYHGSWRADNQFIQPYEHSLTYSANPGDSCQFLFTGTGVRYVYTKASNRGTADIYLDGALLRTIDLYSPTTQWQSSTAFENLKNAEHLIEVRVGQGRNAAATDLYVDVDAFVTLAPVPQGQPTPEDLKRQ
uniref:Glycosyltransferase RgtA/B/C/D-like domain-containing protein n=1 Tax=Solibacter usitatus (strain Ellin6076) TaxID=234267 RepID=Q01UP6_SOLUE